MSDRTLVIVGANLAGGAAATELVERGYDGRIVLIGDETLGPYERPPLSKAYLRGEEAEPTELHPPAWYGEHGIEARLGTRVASIDLEGRAVTTEGDERIGYDTLLIATGGRPRELPGAPAHDRVCYLRRVADADRLRAHLGPGKRLAIVGSGFIGSEVAASARALGTDVTVLDPGTVPLQRVLGEEMGAILAEIHRDHGVDLRPGSRVEGVEASADGVRVGVDGAAPVEADAVVIGIGMVPNVEVADAAGLAVDNGVVVDAWGRASAPGVFAAGDVALHDHPLFGPVRVEHFDNALKMGAAVARTIMGGEEPFDDPHWFWSDQYEHTIQMCGFAMTWDEIVVRGSVADRDFSAFYLKDHVLLSALTIGRPKDVRRAMRLVGSTPDAGALRDEDRDLRTLSP